MTEAQKAKQKKIEEAAAAAVQQERDKKQEQFDAQEAQKAAEATENAVQDEESKEDKQPDAEGEKPQEGQQSAEEGEQPEEEEKEADTTEDVPMPGSVEIVFSGLVNIRRAPSMEPTAICGQARTGQILNVTGKTDDGSFYRLNSGDYIVADPALVKLRS